MSFYNAFDCNLSHCFVCSCIDYFVPRLSSTDIVFLDYSQEKLLRLLPFFFLISFLSLLLCLRFSVICSVACLFLSSFIHSSFIDLFTGVLVCLLACYIMWLLVIDCHRIEHFYEQWAGLTVNYMNHTTTFNSLVEVTCRAGTVPSSQDTVWTCDSQGQWSSSWNFNCRGVLCSHTCFLWSRFSLYLPCMFLTN